MSDSIKMLSEIAKATNGKITEVTILPDNSGFAVMELPLPKDHWLLKEKTEDDLNPPAPLKMGVGPLRSALAEAIREAGKYALRASINSPDEVDFDPDALLQNLVIGLLGYWTTDGNSSL